MFFQNLQLFTIELNPGNLLLVVNAGLCRYVFLSKCRSSQVASSRKKADRFVQKVSMLSACLIFFDLLVPSVPQAYSVDIRSTCSCLNWRNQ